MEQKKEQITKNQHYVPQFYLRKFLNSENRLEVLDCERRQISHERNPRSVCSEDYFYSVNNEFDEVSQVIEKEFQRIEDSISKVYDNIALKFLEFKQINETDKMAIATFMSMQYLRGPYMRKQIQRMDEKMIKHIAKSQFSSPRIQNFFDNQEKETGKKISEEERNKIINIAQGDDYRVEVGNASHLSLLDEMEGFRNLLFCKEWTVYISKSSKKFITSDNPVVELFPEWTGKFFYGPTFLQRTHQFPMTPEITIVATHPINPPAAGKVKRKTLFDNPKDNDKILELNFQHPRYANANAYSSDRQLLQDVINDANLHDKQVEERSDDMFRKLAQIIEMRE